MKMRYIAAAALVGLAACTAESTPQDQESGGGEVTEQNAALASFKVDGMT